MSTSIPLPDFLRHQAPQVLPHGWATATLLRLESESDRRLIGPLHASTPDRKAAVYAALAAIETQDAGALTALSDLTLGEVVAFLLTAPPQDIIEICYGPTSGLGLAGILFKSVHPLAISHYGFLRDVLMGRSERKRRQAKVLTHLTCIDDGTIHALKTLRTAYLTPTIIGALATEEEATRLEELSEFLLGRCCSLPDNVLAQSIAQTAQGGYRDLRSFGAKMLLRYAENLVDLPDGDGLRFVRSSDDVKWVSRDFENCAATVDRIWDMALGLRALAVYTTMPACISLIRIGDGEASYWMCDEMLGPSNSILPPALAAEIAGKLRKHNIICPTIQARPSIPREMIDRYSRMEPILFLDFEGGTAPP